MASSKVIYLARYGKDQPGGAQRCYIGQSDLPLTEEGVRQAERLRDRLGQAGVKAVYCSDLERSVKTARILTQYSGCPVVIRPELREVSLGEWEGLSFAEVIRQYPDNLKRVEPISPITGFQAEKASLIAAGVSCGFSIRL